MGWLTAAWVYARMGEPERFRRSKQVGRLSGLDPSVFQSGEQDIRGHISKSGNSDLRRVLVEAAYNVGRFDQGPLGQFYRRLEKKIGKKRAAVALARKLITVMWRMLVTGETYRGTDPERYESKLAALDRIAASFEPYPTQEAITRVLGGSLRRPKVVLPLRRRTKVPA